MKTASNVYNFCWWPTCRPASAYLGCFNLLVARFLVYNRRVNILYFSCNTVKHNILVWILVNILSLKTDMFGSNWLLLKCIWSPNDLLEYFGLFVLSFVRLFVWVRVRIYIYIYMSNEFESPSPHSYRFDSTTTALLEECIWYQITYNGWYAIFFKSKIRMN